MAVSPTSADGGATRTNAKAPAKTDGDALAPGFRRPGNRADGDQAPASNSSNDRVRRHARSRVTSGAAAVSARGDSDSASGTHASRGAGSKRAVAATGDIRKAAESVADDFGKVVRDVTDTIGKWFNDVFNAPAPTPEQSKARLDAEEKAYAEMADKIREHNKKVQDTLYR